ncbi:redoxin domain-containing protein [Mariniblastus fucicola]|uniref:Glutathione peroxidase n=1 Tax=Mariniblastus fucicola TaxID=980251 RepID=A0A5B9PSK9_9BACT|nr:Hydroperoxy fatty acid reductase gpx1 [Mariniblastus fucicola]
MICRVLLSSFLALMLMPAIAGAQQANGPEVGSQIDEFSLQDQHGTSHKLSELLADGPVALVVFRSADWCPFCRKQLAQLQSDLKAIEESGLKLVGISYDKVDVLAKYAAAEGIQYPLLSDPGSKIIRKIGAVNSEPKEGSRKFNVAHPMTILIGQDSKVVSVVPTTVRQRPGVQEFVEAWKAANKSSTESETESEAPKSALQFKVDNIDGEPVELSKYKGKVVVMVNVASKCGLTPQYEKLQGLYDAHKDDGLMILGFPCNQFGKQEPGTEEEIKSFCQENYGVEFDMFSKLNVNGDEADPLYKYLTAQKTNPKGAGAVKWNFEKFVIDREGNLVGRFSSRTDPEGDEFKAFLAKYLKSEK